MGAFLGGKVRVYSVFCDIIRNSINIPKLRVFYKFGIAQFLPELVIFFEFFGGFLSYKEIFPSFVLGIIQYLSKRNKAIDIVPQCLNTFL